MRKTIYNLYFSYIFFYAAFLLASAPFRPFLHDSEAFTSLAQTLSSLDSLLLIPFVVAVFSAKQLPGRCYWPIFLCLAFDFLILLPAFPIDGPRTLANVFSASLKFAVVLDNLRLRRRLTGHPFGLFDDAYLARQPRFSWPRLVFGLPAFFTGMVLVFSCGIVLTLARTINVQGEGYVRVGWDGLYTKKSVFAKGGQEIYLIGMTHIGDDAYYQKVLDSIPEERTLILKEGVSDREGRLKSGLDYRKVAETLGVETQPRSFPPEIEAKHKIVRADIDISDMDPAMIEKLDAIGDSLDGNWDIARLLKIGKGDEGAFRNAILLARNDHLMAVFDEMALDFERVVIPWGALHGGDISRRLVERGYTLVHSEEMRGIAFFGS